MRARPNLEASRAAGLHGLAAVFDSPDAVLEAARRVHSAGYRRAEAYTPFPITGLSAALGFERTGIPRLVLVGAILGATTGFFMQWFANVIHYRWNIGGRPPNSWPAFIPITFELAVLFAALTAVFGMLILNKLPQLYHPIFKVPGFEESTRDRFFICIESDDPSFDVDRTRAFLSALDPLAVMEVPR